MPQPQILKSPAVLYPFHGIQYLSQHIPQLGPQFIRSLAVSFITTLAILIPLSALTYKLQRRLVWSVLRFIFSTFSFLVPSSLKSLSFLGHNLTTWSTLFLTMGETSLVVALVMGEVVKREKTKSLFNAVLVQNNVSVGPLTTVTHHHPIADTTHTKDKDGESSDSDDDNAKDNDIKYRQDSASKDTINVASTNLSPQVTQRRKRDVIKSASVDLGQRILLWFVTLPLNFIPVVGPLTFCYINAKARIPDIHRRYFDLKEMTVDEREAWIKAHQSDYRAFAFVSQALELIPLLGIFFSFTNTIGAALWAVELERDQETLRKSKRE